MYGTPKQTIFPAAIGLGVAQVGDRLCLLLRVPDEGGFIDIVLDKPLIGELLAHADQIRLRHPVVT